MTYEILKFTFLLTLSSILLTRNTINGLLALILLFIQFSILLFSSESIFLAFAYILVYIGAICVLFLYTVFLLRLRTHSYTNNFLIYAYFFWSFSMLISILFILFASFFNSEDDMSIIDTTFLLTDLDIFSNYLFLSHLLYLIFGIFLLLITLILAVFVSKNEEQYLDTDTVENKVLFNKFKKDSLLNKFKTYLTENPAVFAAGLVATSDTANKWQWYHYALIVGAGVAIAAGLWYYVVPVLVVATTDNDSNSSNSRNSSPEPSLSSTEIKGLSVNPPPTSPREVPLKLVVPPQDSIPPKTVVPEVSQEVVITTQGTVVPQKPVIPAVSQEVIIATQEVSPAIPAGPTVPPQMPTIFTDLRQMYTVSKKRSTGESSASTTTRINPAPDKTTAEIDAEVDKDLSHLFLVQSDRSSIIEDCRYMIDVQLSNPYNDLLARFIDAWEKNDKDGQEFYMEKLEAIKDPIFARLKLLTYDCMITENKLENILPFASEEKITEIRDILQETNANFTEFDNYEFTDILFDYTEEVLLKPLVEALQHDIALANIPEESEEAYLESRLEPMVVLDIEVLLVGIYYVCYAIVVLLITVYPYKSYYYSRIKSWKE